MSIWNGISLDHWAQHQTMNPPRPSHGGRMWYAGVEFIDIGMHWEDYIPAIPLDLRFANFKERLARKLSAA